MEKTGLIERIFARQELNFRNYQALHNSVEFISYDMGLNETYKLLKEVYESEDIHLALGVERLLLEQELQFYSNSPEETQRIKAAIEQFQDAENSLKAVQNPDGYKIAALTYSKKRLRNGIPLDSFHEFLSSHTTRLMNRMAGPLPMPEKNIIRQRKVNLGMIRKYYVALQCKALNLNIQ